LQARQSRVRAGARADMRTDISVRAIAAVIAHASITMTN
jgi:hypothetical protein